MIFSLLLSVLHNLSRVSLKESSQYYVNDLDVSDVSLFWISYINYICVRAIFADTFVTILIIRQAADSWNSGITPFTVIFSIRNKNTNKISRNTWTLTKPTFARKDIFTVAASHFTKLGEIMIKQWKRLAKTFLSHDSFETAIRSREKSMTSNLI